MQRKSFNGSAASAYDIRYFQTCQINDVCASKNSIHCFQIMKDESSKPKDRAFDHDLGARTLDRRYSKRTQAVRPRQTQQQTAFPPAQ